MCQQDIDLPVIPIGLVLRTIQTVDAQLRLLQGFLKADEVVPEIVEHQRRLSVQQLDQLQESLDLAAVDLNSRSRFVLHCSVA